MSAPSSLHATAEGFAPRARFVHKIYFPHDTLYFFVQHTSALQVGKESDVFCHGQVVPKHIVLWAHTNAGPDHGSV